VAVEFLPEFNTFVMFSFNIYNRQKCKNVEFESPINPLAYTAGCETG
jgi:hypothetical protein